METKVYNQKGKDAGKAKLSDLVFGASWNPSLVHQVVVSMQANARTSVAHTKDRSEVAGGGKKPWKQKGTGRARHGSSRSPIWRGGGVTFGPRNEKDYSKKINKKMRSKALFSVLSKKLKDGEMMFLDSVTFDKPSAKEASGVIKALSGVKGYEALMAKKHNSGLIILPERSVAVEKSFDNFGNMTVIEARNANPVAALQHKFVIVVAPDSSGATLESRLKSSVEKDK